MQESKFNKQKVKQFLPLVSIITVSFNSQDSIRDTIESVLGQNYENIEYIIIDGGSTDGTLKIVNNYKNRIDKVISGPDQGVFDAMNKGIGVARGNIIGILNSDDLYNRKDVIKIIVERIRKTCVDVCWGDLAYVKRNNLDKIVRYWKSSSYKEGKFQNGWMPPHPTFFVKKEIYKKYGMFNLNFSISADYELMLRFLEKYKISSCYINEVLVKMRIGGRSNKNLLSLIKGNFECYQSWKVNELNINPLRVLLKPFNKIPQYFSKKKI